MQRASAHRLSAGRIVAAALVVALAGLLLAGALFWRSRQVGVRILATSPQSNAQGVSTRTSISVMFDQPITAQGSVAPLTVSPAVTGTVQWEGTVLSFTPSSRLSPDTIYTVILQAGLTDTQGRVLRRAQAWSFRTGEGRIYYLAADANRALQIYVTAGPGGKATQLTHESVGVWDYTVSPDGLTIAYSAERQDGGHDLYLMGANGQGRRLVAGFAGGVCDQAVWAPDGQRLIYVRQTLRNGNPDPQTARLWWLRLPQAQSSPVFSGNTPPALYPALSADGHWLSYLSPSEQGVAVYNLQDGRRSVFPSQGGVPAVWSPQGHVLLISQAVENNENLTMHLSAANVDSGQVTPLSNEDLVEDTSPAWSPDGQWIAFTRKELAGAQAAAGQQIWLVRPDGTQAHPATADAQHQYGIPDWSPDGRQILCHGLQQADQASPDAGLWLLNPATGALQQLTAKGGWGTWVP